jgi:hypothetical protein
MISLWFAQVKAKVETLLIQRSFGLLRNRIRTDLIESVAEA